MKAARRLRRASYYCSGLWVWLSLKDRNWQRHRSLPVVRDENAILSGLRAVWDEAQATSPKRTKLFQVGSPSPTLRHPVSARWIFCSTMKPNAACGRL